MGLQEIDHVNIEIERTMRAIEYRKQMINRLFAAIEKKQWEIGSLRDSIGKAENELEKLERKRQKLLDGGE
ncbi:MAG: hypothetical protein EOM24_04195 [Chloroflexia bacterium]|nr:hypothetical protein [Chloroflexia bacterium]